RGPAAEGRRPLRDRRRGVGAEARAAVREGGPPAVGLARRVPGAGGLPAAPRGHLREHGCARPGRRARHRHRTLPGARAGPEAEGPRAGQPRQHLLSDALLGTGARGANLGYRARGPVPAGGGGAGGRGGADPRGAGRRTGGAAGHRRVLHAGSPPRRRGDEAERDAQRDSRIHDGLRVMTSTLQRLANVRREEILPVTASMLFFFCVLSALMVIRPAREALGMQSGLDTVRWLFVGTAVVTLAVNPVFGHLVARYRRLSFIATTYLFFAVSLMAFWALLRFAPDAAGEVSGRVFYVWFSVFNLFSTMLFWALMADRFSLGQSKRLFGVIAVGGTMGAVFGPWLAGTVVASIGTANLILIAVGFLVLAVVAAWWVASLQPERATGAADPESEDPPPVDEHAVIGGSAWEGLRAVFRSRYLLAICGFVLVLAVMATFLYFTRLAMV